MSGKLTKVPGQPPLELEMIIIMAYLGWEDHLLE
jgi:hypothetical protein